jgi:hypothetical protein
MSEQRDLLRAVTRLVTGDDLFISYAHSDGGPHAIALAEQLESARTPPNQPPRQPSQSVLRRQKKPQMPDLDGTRLGVSARILPRPLMNRFY